MTSEFKFTSIAAIAVITLFSVIAYSSCRKNNKCPTCLNGGSCNNGSCSCPSNYFGSVCQYKHCPTCLNNGVCDSATGSCNCPAGYFGINCEFKNCPTCLNGGYCDTTTGSCVCAVGYEGANCGTLSRNKFLGNWQVFEKGSNTNASQYAISIVEGSAITSVAIKNFFNYFTIPVNGYITGDSLYIPNQHLQGKTVFGAGYIYNSPTYGTNGAITMYYEIIDSATNIIDDFGYYPPDLSAPSAWNK